MSSVTLKEVKKTFDTTEVLHGFSQQFYDGEFVTLLGPSGCGKTTMLRIIAGFEHPTSGEVWIDALPVSTPDRFVAPEDRGIGMVFQSYAVWPHMTVFENVAYPLKIKKLPRAEIKKRTEEVLEAVHLTPYASRVPSQLSGGQQQRVALGRALVAQPRLLLLDEPLSNLDAKLRETMRYEIKGIQKKLGITVVYVTHDQIEAMTMSDRIVVMRDGTICQVGTPEEIYRAPVDRFVADFVGKINLLPAEARQGSVMLCQSGQSLPYAGPLRGPVTVAIRPESIAVGAAGQVLRGRLADRFYLGDVTDCRVDLGGELLRFTASAAHYAALAEGQELTLSVDSFLVFGA